MLKNKFGFDCIHYNSHFCDPPGSHIDILDCPTGNNEFAIERAIIKEHRFAFFFWSKWTTKFRKRNFGESYSPNLVSLDYHKDLHQPNKDEQAELIDIDLDNLEELAKFTWARLNILNDGHIKSALYKNVIGDVYVLCKQAYEERTYQYKDYLGNAHNVFLMNGLNSLLHKLNSSNSEHIYFDIDLDYFVKKEGNFLISEPYILYDESEIIQLINPRSELMQWVLPKMNGFTIAMEPSFCGGMRNSAWLLQIIDEQLFTNIYEWKHLQSNI